MQTPPHTPDHLVDGGHQPGTPGELAAADALRAQALGATAVQGSLLEQIQHTAHEPGVRTQL